MDFICEAPMKTKNMNFMEAAKAISDGKKVKRKDWDYNMCMYLVNKEIYFNPNAQGRNLMIEEIEATDWEIVEEKKTLSDKLISIGERTEIKGIHKVAKEEDVKESLKEFLNQYEQSDIFSNLYIRAKEIFGERLI